MQNKKIIVCPNCKNECYICLDEWGRTPWHIHCDSCNINIGVTNIQKGISLLEKYHKPNTYLEFYSNQIKFLIINGEELISEFNAE